MKSNFVELHAIASQNKNETEIIKRYHENKWQNFNLAVKLGDREKHDLRNANGNMQK